MNTKYYFLHIPKAGGTTLHHILDRRFKKSEQFMYSTLYPKKSMEIINNMSANKLNSIKLFKGHFVYGFHEWFDIDNPKYFTVLRNPIDRVMSHYLYSARKKNHYLYEKRTSSDISLFKYVKELCPEARNGMTKQIAGFYVNDNFGYGTQRIERCEDQALLFDKAIINIENSFVLVGLMEEFDKFLSLLHYTIGGKKILYQYYKRNINKNRNVNESYKISEKEREIINDYNKADMKLYDYCKNNFIKKFEKLYENISDSKFEVKSVFKKRFLDISRYAKRFL